MAKPDFAGYVTRYNRLCTDGHTIKPGAFKDFDGVQLPLVWDHKHDELSNVLGHVKLSHRADGVYGEAYLNNSDNAQLARDLVIHGDLDSFSIWANKLKKNGMDVIHGVLREVSLVLSGANDGARIDYVSVAHSGGDDYEFEGIVFSGDALVHGDALKDSPESDDDAQIQNNDEEDAVETHVEDTEETEVGGGKTIDEIFETLNPEQKQAVDLVFEALLNPEASDEDDEEDYDADDEDAVVEHRNNNEGDTMSRNVFDTNDGTEIKHTSLTSAELSEIVGQAKKGGSLKDAFIAHAGTYGIDDIEYLFPDAKAFDALPQFIKRDTSWVSVVMNGVKKTPFTRVKSIVADITGDEARARGYTKGGLKVEEVFALLKRTTGPTTIYKKQKLDRDDILDITDIDVVVWLKAEMRLMLEEEIARAILLGDGRSVASPDKISDPAGEMNGNGIRSILNEHILYAETREVDYDPEKPSVLENAVVRARKAWKGTGTPTFFTTIDVVADLRLQTDLNQRRIYDNDAQVAGAMRVAGLVEVELMEEYEDLIGIMVNLADYSIGTDKGGAMAFFDDFDIDYNQMKYLYETRISGALTRPKSAIIFKKKAAQVTP